MQVLGQSEKVVCEQKRCPTSPQHPSVGQFPSPHQQPLSLAQSARAEGTLPRAHTIVNSTNAMRRARRALSVVLGLRGSVGIVTSISPRVWVRGCPKTRPSQATRRVCRLHRGAWLANASVRRAPTSRRSDGALPSRTVDTAWGTRGQAFSANRAGTVLVSTLRVVTYVAIEFVRRSVVAGQRSTPERRYL